MRNRLMGGLGALIVSAGIVLLVAPAAGATTYKTIYTSTWSGLHDLSDGSASTEFKLVQARFTVEPWACAADGRATTQGVRSIGVNLASPGLTLGQAVFAPCKPSSRYTADSVRFAASGPSGTIGHNATLGGIHAGDHLFLEVHYALSSDVMYFYAKDLTSGQFAFFNVNMAKLHLYSAYIYYANIGVTMDNADITPPASSVSLAGFSQCQVDSNSHNGTGAASRSWPTREVFDSLDATSNPLTLAASLDSAGLTNSGQNFTVYLRPTG